MPTITITVNGVNKTARVDEAMLLVEFLRENLRLTGTHVGCDTSQCGCCTVHLDDMAVKSCTLLAVQANGRTVKTIEGLARQDGTLHPVQKAMHENHGLQCGFCTPGVVMNLADFLAKNPDPTEDEVREALEGNLCRCTGYQGIVDAALAAAKHMRDKLEDAAHV